MDTKKFLRVETPLQKRVAPLSPSIFLYVSNHSDHTHSYEGRTEGQAKTRERLRQRRDGSKNDRQRMQNEKDKVRERQIDNDNVERER